MSYPQSILGPALGALLVTLPSVTVAAQAPVGSFSANRYAPAPGAGNYLEVDGVDLPSNLGGSFGLTLDYAHEPLVLRSVSCTDPAAGTGCQVEEVRSEIVSYAATANLWAAIAFAERVQLSVLLPLSLTSGEGFEQMSRGGDTIRIEGGSVFGMGDPRIAAKFRLLGKHDDVFRLGAVLWAGLPLGDLLSEGRFLGNSSVSFGGHAIAQIVTGGFHLAFNVGGMWREEQTLLSTTQGPEISYRGVIGYAVNPKVLIFAEVSGATGLSGDFDENPVEARLVARMDHRSLRFTLGAGAGVLSGVGVPVFRVLAGFAFLPGTAPAANGPDEPDWEAPSGCRPADLPESPADRRPVCAERPVISSQPPMVGPAAPPVVEAPAP